MTGGRLLSIGALDALALDGAAHLVAAEHAAAVSMRSGLPSAFLDPTHCRDALAGLLTAGHRGVVAHEDGRYVGVLSGRVAGEHAVLRAEGIAVAPDLEDPTSVLVGLYAELAPLLLAEGAIHHHATHVDLPKLSLAFNNLGFGRGAVYACRPAEPRERRSHIEVRIGSADDIDAIVELSSLEMSHRFTPPIYAPPHASTSDDVRNYHVGLLDDDAVHLIARVGPDDVGLVTLEFNSPAPRLCTDRQPYIGPTAVHPSARGRGIGRALVDAALDWSVRHGFHMISVDFASANPLSRPFWLGAGFQPTGYGVVRSIHPSYVATSSSARR